MPGPQPVKPDIIWHTRQVGQVSLPTRYLTAARGIYNAQRDDPVVREVQIAEDSAPDSHGHAQERPHGGVAIREAGRRRMAGDVIDTDGHGMVDEQSEHTSPRGQ